MAHRHTEAESHASKPGNFAPARFVFTTVGGGGSCVMLADNGKLVKLTRTFPDSATAFALLDGMERADAICRFCNGDAAGSICNDCGMEQ